jgi:hypothetical protein
MDIVCDAVTQAFGVVRVVGATGVTTVRLAENREDRSGHVQSSSLPGPFPETETPHEA